MITKWLGTLSSGKLYLLAAGLSLVCIAGAFGAGYLLGGRQEARYQTKEIVKTVYVPFKEIQEVQVRNVERERELQASLGQNQVLVDSLRKRLALVSTNLCPVAPDAVGVLNEAITGTPEANPTGVDADQGTTVTDLTDWSLTVISQYNELRTRHNALVDWVDEELIEPQSE